MSSVVYSTYSPTVFHPQMKKRIFRSNGLSITLLVFISHKLLPTLNESKETSEQYSIKMKPGKSPFIEVNLKDVTCFWASRNVDRNLKLRLASFRKGEGKSVPPEGTVEKISWKDVTVFLIYFILFYLTSPIFRVAKCHLHLTNRTHIRLMISLP